MGTKTENKKALAVLKQYEENSKAVSTTKKTYDLKNYFTARLKDGEKEGEKRVRILPGANDESPFKEVYIHKIQIKGQWKKFLCLNHNFDKECPFCEARQALLATGDSDDKELAKNYGARKAYVVKVIDRDCEEEGVKFWRFNHDYRNEGIFDKVVSIFKKRGDVTDVENGRDISISLGRNQKNHTIINSVIPEDESRLSDDSELEKTWLADTRTWEDVYSIKPYEFLEIVVKGGDPGWNKKTGGWVDKSQLSDDEIAALESDIAAIEKDDEAPAAITKPVVAKEKAKVKVAEAVAEKVKKVLVKVEEPADEEDDLPF